MIISHHPISGGNKLRRDKMIGYTKTDIQEKSTEELKALSPIVKECWLDEVDELVSSHRLGDYWLIERELRAREINLTN